MAEISFQGGGQILRTRPNILQKPGHFPSEQIMQINILKIVLLPYQLFPLAEHTGPKSQVGAVVYHPRHGFEGPSLHQFVVVLYFWEGDFDYEGQVREQKFAIDCVEDREQGYCVDFAG